MENIIVKKPIKIENYIYEIRGKQVMLDSDLARFYNCKNGTKSINLAVKRHIKRFPKRFMFQLTEEEFNDLRFQVETATKNLKFRFKTSKDNLWPQIGTANMSRTLPYVFTEQGVAMLSAILRTEVAEEISVKIMDAFVAMRHYIGNNEFRISNVEQKVIEHDNDILDNILKRYS